MFILGLPGVLFNLAGGGLTLGAVTAFAGLSFMAIGVVLLGLAAAGLYWRFGHMYKLKSILRVGEAAKGCIVED